MVVDPPKMEFEDTKLSYDRSEIEVVAKIDASDGRFHILKEEINLDTGQPKYAKVDGNKHIIYAGDNLILWYLFFTVYFSTELIV